MSIDDLKQIARLQWIKDYDNLSKEDRLYVLLRSENNLLEHNYIEYLNNNTDDRIKAKINNIRIALIKLRNIINKKDRDKIKKDLNEIEKKKRLTKTQEKRIYNHLIELASLLNKKGIYKNADYDDLDYFGVKDIENLFNYIDDADYYESMLRTSFKNNYEYYKIRGDRDKKLSIKQYLYIVITYLAELINKEEE